MPVTLKQERAAKKRLAKRLHDEWSKAVKDRDGWVCQKDGCGRTTNLNSHHAYGKGAHPSVRYDVDNGVTLCAGHHLFWAHKEGLEFSEWFRKRLGKKRYEALRRRANGTTKDL